MLQVPIPFFTSCFIKGFRTFPERVSTWCDELLCQDNRVIPGLMELLGTKLLHQKAAMPGQLCWLQSRVYGPSWYSVAVQSSISLCRANSHLPVLPCHVPSKPLKQLNSIKVPSAAKPLQAVKAFHLIALCLSGRVGSVTGQTDMTQGNLFLEAERQLEVRALRAFKIMLDTYVQTPTSCPGIGSFQTLVSSPSAMGMQTWNSVCLGQLTWKS